MQGQLNTAKKLYLRAINEGTKDPAAHANLGFILKEEGKLEKALSETKKALSIAPNNALFNANAGGILLEMCSYKECIKYSLTALRIEPNDPRALSNLACAYKEIGDTENALRAALLSLQLQPNNPITLTSIGYILISRNDTEKALEAASAAINLDANLSSAYTLKGKALAAKGNIDQAILAFNKALTLNKDCGEALLGLCMGIKTEEQANQLIKIANEVDTDKTSKEDEISLYYSYANCFHKLKDYRNSTLNLLKAHQAKRVFLPSDADWHCKKIEHFNNIKYDHKIENNPKDKPRIFIVGMPRCGSTLLETALSSSPEVQDLGETNAFGLALEEWTKNKEKNLSLDKLYENFISAKASSQAKYTVDKQLYNFQHTGLICSHLPKAKVIHCRRNPLDNILSMLRSHLTVGNNYTVSAEDCARVLIQQETIMNNFKRNWSEQIYTFDYDDFVCRPEPVLKSLTNWLELKWNNDYLHPERSCRTINTASVVQARQPINKDSLEGWRNYPSLLEPAMSLITNCGLFNDFDFE